MTAAAESPPQEPWVQEPLAAELAGSSALAAEPFAADGLSLEPVTLQLRRQPGPLLAQIERALAVHGTPVRWAITAVEPGPGGGQPGALLRIEAVVQIAGATIPPAAPEP